MPDVDLNELERYLRIYQENPDSRVFAPLADMYRRLARYREAEQICREGLQRHPYYAGGKVALAYILLDTNRLSEAYQEINSVVTYYPDNLMARKILIRVLVGMGQREKAVREHAALLQLAPQMGSDPELERVLRSDVASPSPQEFEKDVRVSKPALKPANTIDKTEPDVSVLNQSFQTIARDRKRILLKKKMVLEHWLRRLETT